MKQPNKNFNSTWQSLRGEAAFAKRTLLAVSLLLLSIMLPTAAVAQGQTTAETYTVSGVVVGQSADGVEELPFVNVALLRPSDSTFVRGASSAMDGKFVINGVPAGDYLLRATFIGYHDLYRTLSVRGSLTLDTLLLRASNELLEAVNIEADKPVYAMDGEKHLYNVKEDPSAQGGTAADVLRRAPGVEVDAQGNVSLRGTKSVEIWINDQPANLDEESLRNYLKQMPAESIERVEVITNPSARYANRGGGGVINLVTNSVIKRNEFLSLGLNGSSMPYVVPWISYVYVNERLSMNVFLNGNLVGSWWNRSLNSTTLGDDGQPAERLSDSIHTDISQLSFYGMANVEYKIDDRNAVSGYLGLIPSWYDLDMRVASTRDDLLNHRHYAHTLTSDQQTSYLYGFGNVRYQHKFDTLGQSLSLELSGNGRFSNEKADQYRAYAETPAMDRADRIAAEKATPHYGIEADYVKPFGKNATLEAGVMWSDSRERSRMETLDSSAATAGMYRMDSLRSCVPHFVNQSLQGYATWQQRFGKFTAKAGLRAVGDFLSGSVTGTSQVVEDIDKAYFNLRPSLHLSYNTESMHSFNVSYARQIASPQAQQLMTYRSYPINQESFSTGNPLLQSTFTNSFEAGWSKYIASFGSVSLQGYHKNRQQEVNTVTDVVFDDYYGRPVAFMQEVNLGDSYSTGMELNVTWRPQPFMSLSLYANLFHNSFEAVYKGVEYSDGMTSYSFRLNYWGRVWKVLDLFANAGYTSPTVGLFSETLSSWQVSAGVSTDLLERKLSLFFMWNDIFGSSRSGSVVSGPIYSANDTQTSASSMAIFGVTLRFGTMELESKAQKGGMTGGMM